MRRARRIIEDWNAINDSVYDGSYTDKYRIGDTKKLCGEEMVVTSIGKDYVGGPYLEFKSVSSSLTICMF